MVIRAMESHLRMAETKSFTESLLIHISEHRTA